jgi:hypothetical protein
MQAKPAKKIDAALGAWPASSADARDRAGQGTSAATMGAPARPPEIPEAGATQCWGGGSPDGLRRRGYRMSLQTVGKGPTGRAKETRSPQPT